MVLHIWNQSLSVTSGSLKMGFKLFLFITGFRLNFPLYLNVQIYLYSWLSSKTRERTLSSVYKDIFDLSLLISSPICLQISRHHDLYCKFFHLILAELAYKKSSCRLVLKQQWHWFPRTTLWSCRDLPVGSHVSLYLSALILY